MANSKGKILSYIERFKIQRVPQIKIFEIDKQFAIELGIALASMVVSILILSVIESVIGSLFGIIKLISVILAFGVIAIAGWSYFAIAKLLFVKVLENKWEKQLATVSAIGLIGIFAMMLLFDVGFQQALYHPFESIANAILFFFSLLLIPAVMMASFLYVTFTSKIKQIAVQLAVYAALGVVLILVFGSNSFAGGLGTLLIAPFAIWVIIKFKLIQKLLPLLGKFNSALNRAGEDLGEAAGNKVGDLLGDNSRARSSSSSSRSEMQPQLVVCPNCGKEDPREIYECTTCLQEQCGSCSSSHGGSNHCLHKNERLKNSSLEAKRKKLGLPSHFGLQPCNPSNANNADRGFMKTIYGTSLSTGQKTFF